METLPEDQDKLLKELHDIEEEEKVGIWAERSKIMLVLIIILVILYLVSLIFDISEKDYSLIPVYSSLVLVTITGLIGAYFNKKWGFYISTIILILATVYATYTTTDRFSAVVTLLDSLAIFTAATLFHRKGFAIASLLMIAKAITFLVIGAGNDYDYSKIAAYLINMTLTGYVPVLIQSVSLSARVARKQTLRAEILSLQNQELLQTWGDFYKGNKAQSTENREQRAENSEIN